MKQRNFLRLRHAKAHDDGTLKNPLFLKIKTPRWRIGAACIAGIVLALSAAIGITHIPVLQLQTVTVHGTVTLDPSAIEQGVRDHIASHRLPWCSKTNVYLTRLRVLEEGLAQQFPLQAVSVSRIGQSLEVAVTEKVTTIALRTKEKTVMLDVAGAYVRDATVEESRAIDIRIGSATANADELVTALQPDMPIVINTENDGVTALSEATTELLIAFTEQLPLNGMHVVAFYLDGLTAPFARIDTTEAYDLYVDIGLRSAEEQMQALHAIVSVEHFVPPAAYIDLRFGAYVYMK